MFKSPFLLASVLSIKLRQEEKTEETKLDLCLDLPKPVSTQKSSLFRSKEDKMTLQKDNDDLQSLLDAERAHSKELQSLLDAQRTHSRELESLLVAERTHSRELESLLVGERTRSREFMTAVAATPQLSEMSSEGDLSKAAPGVRLLTRLWEERTAALLEPKSDRMTDGDSEPVAPEVEDEKTEPEEVQEVQEIQEIQPLRKKTSVTISLDLEEDPEAKERRRREEKEQEHLAELEVLRGEKEELAQQLEAMVAERTRSRELMTAVDATPQPSEMSSEGDLCKVPPGVRLLTQLWEERTPSLLDPKSDQMTDGDSGPFAPEVEDEKTEEEVQEIQPLRKKTSVTISLVLEEDPEAKDRRRREEKEQEHLAELEVMRGEKEELAQQLEVLRGEKEELAQQLEAMAAERTRSRELMMDATPQPSEMSSEGDLCKAPSGVRLLTRLWEERTPSLLDPKSDQMTDGDSGPEVEDEKTKEEVQEIRPLRKKTSVTISLVLGEDPEAKEPEHLAELEVLREEKEKLAQQLEAEAAKWRKEKASFLQLVEINRQSLEDEERDYLARTELLRGEKEEVERQLKAEAGQWQENKAQYFLIINLRDKEIQAAKLEIQNITEQLNRVQNERWYHRLLSRWSRFRASNRPQTVFYV